MLFGEFEKSFLNLLEPTKPIKSINSKKKKFCIFFIAQKGNEAPNKKMGGMLDNTTLHKYKETDTAICICI